ncbi:MAG: divergent PAP2 family protein [bacterium]
MGLLHNPVLLAALLAWFIAQTLKVIFSVMQTGKIDFRRFVGAGGMPSSHSALAMGLTAKIGMTEGWGSTIFALSLVTSLVIMYDAANVRRAAGEQAEVLNKMIDELFHDGTIREERLKELLGHTPLEVVAGAILGVAVAVIL